jgi:lipoic acid synthetase
MAVFRLLERLHLHTVCQGAKCPNMPECFGRGTATFLILGSVCTRNCRFCAVPDGAPSPLDENEPANVAEAVATLKLRHAVVTSVTRDDLADGGSAHFAKTIREIRSRCAASVEVLTPDFKGREEDIARVADALPDVFNHNVETVPRLYPVVRPQADYRRSLELLRFVKNRRPEIVTKSGLMVGVGETNEEVVESLRDLRDAGCDFVTIGQYLRPSKAHLPIARFVPPEEFEELAQTARSLGFGGVASAPFVRSSYHAGEMFEEPSGAENESQEGAE